MNKPYEANRTERVRKSLAEAGLVEIKLHEFPGKLKHVKHVAIQRLGELLELKTFVQEQQSVAHSLGTLKAIETNLHGDVAAEKISKLKSSR
jgi:hypothetical protein